MIKKILIFKKMSKVLISEDKMKELAKSVSAEEVSFVNYFKIFQSLYDSSNPTSFANYFHKVSLFELENVNKIKNEDSFLKAISSFINEVTYDKKKIYFELSNEESIQKVLKVLKMLKTPKKYIYYIRKAKPQQKGAIPALEIAFAKNKELFEYVEKYGDKDFVEEELNEVDNVILSLVSYIDFTDIVSNKSWSVSARSHPLLRAANCVLMPTVSQRVMSASRLMRAR